MLAIRIDLLTGRYAATRFNDRDSAEWPPHPARLFSALVAAHADDDDPDAAERETLLWFESLGPPEISASGASSRSPVIHFVPNNEAAAVVVGSSADNYAKLGETERLFADGQARLASDPEDRDAGNTVRRSDKALGKLRRKIEDDSASRSAAKPHESQATVAAGVQLLPDQRGKQGRVFPVSLPAEPTVFFTWPAAEAGPERRDLLDGLLARVARLGHSSSLVSCSIVEAPPVPTLVPSPHGAVRLRVTAPGLLDELELAFEGHQGCEPRVLPSVQAAYAAYLEPGDDRPCPHLGEDWIVLSDPSGSLPTTRTLDLTTAVRGAVLSHAADPLPEILSGHVQGDPGAGTAPSTRPHMAVVALPFVGHHHADGGIRGVAIVLPRDVTRQERDAVSLALRAWTAASGRGVAIVTMGRSGRRELELGDQLSPIATLKAETWCRPSMRWVSATPVALDRFPGDLWSSVESRRQPAEQRAIESISRACTYVGLPEPAEVQVLRASPLDGVPDLRRFPVYRSPGRGIRRMTVHVSLTFTEPVRGPMLIGAGRYFGYGLLRPVGPVARSGAASPSVEALP